MCPTQQYPKGDPSCSLRGLPLPRLSKWPHHPEDRGFCHLSSTTDHLVRPLPPFLLHLAHVALTPQALATLASCRSPVSPPYPDDASSPSGTSKVSYPWQSDKVNSFHSRFCRITHLPPKHQVQGQPSSFCVWLTIWWMPDLLTPGWKHQEEGTVFVFVHEYIPQSSECLTLNRRFSYLLNEGRKKEAEEKANKNQHWVHWLINNHKESREQTGMEQCYFMWLLPDTLVLIKQEGMSIYLGRKAK